MNNSNKVLLDIAALYPEVPSMFKIPDPLLLSFGGQRIHFYVTPDGNASIRSNVSLEGNIITFDTFQIADRVRASAYNSAGSYAEVYGPKCKPNGASHKHAVVALIRLAIEYKRKQPKPLGSKKGDIDAK